MKKLFALLLALLFVLPLLSSFSGCESQKSAAVDTNKDEGSRTEQPELTKEATETPTEAPTEQPTEAPTEPAETPSPEPTTRPTEPEHASTETLALAESTLDYMVEEKLNFWPGIDIYVRQYANLRYDQKISALEEPADSALALVEIYESYVDYYENTDLALFFSAYYSYVFEPGYVPPEGLFDWMEMEEYRRTVEGLLSMNVYYNKLTGFQRERFYSDLIRIWDCYIAAEIEAFGEGKESKYSDFDISKREQDLSWVPIIGNANRTDPVFDVSGVSYYLGYQVYTTAGYAVQTYASSGELTQQIISVLSNQGTTVTPQATLVSGVTPKNNCHAYAWYNVALLENKWIDVTYGSYPGVETYISDPHCSLPSSTPSVGAIVVYQNSSSQYAHSGIVTQVSPNVMVRSKWGQGCVWLHRLDAAGETAMQIN